MRCQDNCGTSTRRELLQAGGIAAATALVAGCSMPDEEDTESGEPATTAFNDLRGMAFEDINRVNVTAVGADPTGTEDIVPNLQESLATENDPVGLFFPPGEYLINQKFDATNHTSRVLLVGRNAKLRIGNDIDTQHCISLGTTSTALDHVQLQGFQIDVSEAPDIHFIKPLVTNVNNQLIVRDVQFVSKLNAPNGEFYTIKLSDGASGLIENTHILDGQEPRPGGVGNQSKGMIVQSGSRGRITFRDCSVNQTGDNGIYVGSGTALLENCHVRNTTIDGIRISDNASIVRNCTVTYDEEMPSEFRSFEGNGIRVREAENWLVEGCSVRDEAGVWDGGDFCYRIPSTHGSGGTMRDCEAHSESALRLLQTQEDNSGGTLKSERVAIAGFRGYWGYEEAESEYAIEINRRTTMRDSVVECPNTRGISVVDTPDCIFDGLEVRAQTHGIMAWSNGSDRLKVVNCPHLEGAGGNSVRVDAADANGGIIAYNTVYDDIVYNGEEEFIENNIVRSEG